MSGIREGRWLCKSCGSICRGRDERCEGEDGRSGCGKSRPLGTRFFLPENSPYVTSPDLLADAMSGRDWHCDHCDGANKGSVGGHPVTSCAHCGNARDGSDHDVPVIDVSGGAPSSPEEATDLEREDEIRDRSRRLAARNDAGPLGVKTYRRANASPRVPKFAILMGALAVFFIGFLIWATAFARYENAHVVESHRWSRNVEMEEFRALKQDGWDPPGDARIGRSEIRIRSYVSVIDRYETRTRQVSRSVPIGTESYGCGTRDVGNGYFQDVTCSRTVYRTVYETESYQDPVYRQDPVYDDWHEWEVDRWVHDRNFPSAGAGTERFWADTPPKRPGLREAGRSERLWLVLRSEKGDKDWPVSEALWLSLRDGAEITTTTDYWGRVLRATGADGAEIDFRP